MLTFAADSDDVMIPERLPPLVSFQLYILPKCTNTCGSSRLSLPSLCSQVAASLKKLSLSWVNSSDLQYIGDHLPLLEVLQFRCVVYIAFEIISIVIRCNSYCYD